MSLIHVMNKLTRESIYPSSLISKVSNPDNLGHFSVYNANKNGENLKLLLLEHNTPDPRRESYEEWRIEKQKMVQETGDPMAHALSPEGSEIYLENKKLINDGYIEPDDKILLYIDLHKIGEEMVAVNFMRRHPSLSGKGIASEFYLSKIVPSLKSQGFRYIKLNPLNQKISQYWKQLGFTPATEIKEELLPELDIPFDNKGTIYVHFLFSEDLKRFVT